MSRQTLYTDLINELPNLQINDEFLISDMFKGYQWKKISKADRLWLGREFLDKVKNNKVTSVKSIEKTSSNKQVYKKI